MNLAERIADVMSACARHRGRVLAVMLVLDLVAVGILAFVPPEVETDVQAGTFPRNDPEANAFRALRADVAGINSELVYFELRDGATAAGEPVTDVRDFAASRSIEDLYDYVDRRFQEETGEDKVVAYTGFPYLVKLVHSYFPNGAFEMPATQEDYDRAVQVLESTDDGSLAFYFSEDYQSTIISILYDPFGDKAATAGLINDLIAEYRALPPGGDKPLDLWDDAYLDGWGVHSWIAIVDRSVERDLLLLVPAALAVLMVVLTVALRDVRRAAFAMLTVGNVQLWTLAAMTLLGLPIGFISMALFPLLLGVGVDYAIHLQHEALLAGGDGLRRSGRRAGSALVIATVTTIAGFAVIMLSGSPMIMEISAATIIGMALMLIASLTVLPALMSFVPGRKRDVGPGWHALGGFLRRRRIPVAVAVVALVAIASPLAGQTQFATQTVQANLPDEPSPSHMLVMYDRFEERMETTGNEAIIHQGDLTRPAAMEEIIQTHLTMEQAELFDGVLSLPFALELHLDLEGGSLGPLQGVLDGVVAEAMAPIMGPPERFDNVRELDQSGLRSTMEGMWNDDRWAPLIRSFTDDAYTITWTFSFIDVPLDAAATGVAEETMVGIIADVGPTELDTHSFGTLTALHRINEQAAHWLTLSAVVDLVVLGALVGWFTRRWRAVAAATTTLAIGMVAWLILLSEGALDLRLSFVYLIPLAFITSLGSDYAVHMVNALVRGGNAREEVAGVGRAVVYSAFTTAAAFAVFLFGSINGSVEMFGATIVAVLVAAVVTLGIVPAWFPRNDDEAVSVGSVSEPV